MIIVRVHLRLTEKASSSEHHRGALPVAMDHPTYSGGKSRLNDQLKPIAVNVLQYVHRHMDAVELESIDHGTRDQKASDASNVNIDAV